MGAARQTGERLARAAINAMCDADRNRMRFCMTKPTLASSIRQLKLPIRSDLRGRIQPEFDVRTTSPSLSSTFPTGSSTAR